MEFRHLRYFCVVAEEGHVTRAAKRLNIAQPALTQQIKLLEAEIGVTLFRKVGRGVQITTAGRYLQKEAKSLLDHIQSVTDQTRVVAGSDKDGMTVGISDVEMLAGNITGLLKRYRETSKHVTVREVMLSPKDVASALRDGRVDAAFSCAAVPDLHDLTRYKLGVGQAVVAVPITHRLAKKSSLTLEEALTEPIILLSHGETPGSFEVRFRKECVAREISPHLLEVTPHLLLALNMVASGAGIALLPVDVEGLRADAIAYIPLKNAAGLTVEFVLYTRRGERCPSINALLKLLPGK